MSAETEDAARFFKWVSRPQSLIALSALLLSVCGVFIAVYEAALVRRQQRASVWPHVEVGASTSRERVEVWVRNVGVGPARVHAAAVSQGGETRKDWEDLTRRAGVERGEMDSYYSLISGTVLPRDSERKVIFRLTEEDGNAAPELIALLRREILGGQIDVTLCYCSVYEECWTSGLQDVIQRSRGVEIAAGERALDGCGRAPRSGI